MFYNQETNDTILEVLNQNRYDLKYADEVFRNNIKIAISS